MSLRRVSSRQRLVSWDAFDATVSSPTTELLNRVSPSSSKSNMGIVEDRDNLPTISGHSNINTTPSVLLHIDNDSDTDIGVDYDMNNDNNATDSDDSFDFKRKRRVVQVNSKNDTRNPNETNYYPFYSNDIDQKQHQNINRNDDILTIDTDYVYDHDNTNLMQLPIEILCSIGQYLNIKDLRHVTQTCTTLRQLLLLSNRSSNNNYDSKGDDMKLMIESALWKPFCIQQYWPWLHDAPPDASFIISTNSSTANDMNMEHHDFDTDAIRTKNYPMLLSMASYNAVPMQIETSLFPMSRLRTGSTNRGTITLINGNRYMSSSNLQSIVQPKIISIPCTVKTTITITTITKDGKTVESTKTITNNQQHKIIQFIGSVGQGDQCIRTNIPLPRPRKLRIPQKWNYQNRYMSLSSRQNLFQRVFRNTITANNNMSPRASLPTTISPITQATTGSNIFCPLRRSPRLLGNKMSSSNASISASTAAASRILSYRPFITPFVSTTVSTATSKSNSNNKYENTPFAVSSPLSIDITPRYIAYYEVTILPREGGGNDTTTMTTSQQQQVHHDEFGNISSTTTITTKNTISIQYPKAFTRNSSNNLDTRNSNIDAVPIQYLNNQQPQLFPATNTISDCVAVGIGTKAFQINHRMPGWDIHSYGYHGDDGGIFHGNGSMIQQYNTTFTCNDTIGCGIDYINQSIFFTLNGKFLGYAFTLLAQHIDIDLYPIIGMDTQYPIFCNFGNTNVPFQFDLSCMIQQQQPIIQQQMCI